MIQKNGTNQWVTVDKSALNAASGVAAASRRGAPQGAYRPPTTDRGASSGDDTTPSVGRNSEGSVGRNSGGGGSNSANYSQPRGGATSVSTSVSPSPTKQAGIDRAQKQRRELKQAQKEVKKLTDDLTESTVKVDELKLVVMEKNLMLSAVEEELKKTKDCLETAKKNLIEYDAALKSTNTICRASLSPELAAATEKMIKTVLFRTWKFLEDEADLILATEETYEWLEKIPNFTLTMDKELYTANYKILMQKSLAEARQYVQSECKKRAKGKFG